MQGTSIEIRDNILHVNIALNWAVQILRMV